MLTQAERDLAYEQQKERSKQFAYQRPLPNDGGLARLLGWDASAPYPMYGTPDGIHYNSDGVRIEAIEWTNRWHDVNDLIHSFFYSPLTPSAITRFKHEINAAVAHALPFDIPDGKLLSFDVVQDGPNSVVLRPVIEATVHNFVTLEPTPASQMRNSKPSKVKPKKHWADLLRFWRKLPMFKEPKSGLKTELANLRKRISATEDYMGRLSNDFWANGGVCCPSCGVPGYSELSLKQERREERIKQILAKLARDTKQEDKA